MQRNTHRKRKRERDRKRGSQLKDVYCKIKKERILKNKHSNPAPASQR